MSHRGRVLESFTLGTFEPLVGTVFRLALDDGRSLDLVLAAARSLAIAGWSGAREPFSLTFLSSREPLLPQRIYSLTHPGLGTFAIFLVPIQPLPDAQRYEAVFS
jgi:hypothetical protein